MIHNPDYSYDDRRKFQTIFTEEIEGELISALPGQSSGEKKLKTDILEVVFMTRSWGEDQGVLARLAEEGVRVREATLLSSQDERGSTGRRRCCQLAPRQALTGG